MDPLVLTDLRGGLNLGESPHALRDDELQVCLNIDLDRGTLGGKRRGTDPVGNGYAGDIRQATFLFRHTPDNDERLTELWLGGLNASGAGDLDYRDTNGWATYTNVTFGLDTLIAESGAYALEAQSLHGKMFLAYPAESGGEPVDRLHVRETEGGVTTFRRAGIRQPATPSAADTAGAGAYTGTRYVRQRYTVQSAGITLRRSEPSDTLTFAPSGTKNGMTVTRSALLGEGETHWELELSLDNINFYVVATQAIATSTYTDTVADTIGYRVATGENVSPDIGDYELIWSPKYLAADDDRLLFGGAWVNADYKSRVGWTPVRLADGNGNDERIETDTDPYVDLDGFEGGELTDLAGPVNGYVTAFKASHIYRLSRTGVRSKSYEPICLTKKVGALPRSVVEGVDEYGRPCLYFADPEKGPHRLGASGVEHVSEGIRDLWTRINLDATLPCHAVWYPDERQVWWWIALDGAMFPNTKVVLHVRHMRRDIDGTRRGWSEHDGTSATALAATVYADNIEDVPSAVQSLHLKPYLTLASGVASGEAMIQQADIGETDDGDLYQGTFKTKAWLNRELLGVAGVMRGTLLAETASGSSVTVSLIRDFGIETKSVAVSLTPRTSEVGLSRVVRRIDELNLSEMFVLEIEVGDTAASASTWALDALALERRAEEAS